eukprot:360578-Chlamydomonas_euryale.AAC.3
MAIIQIESSAAVRMDTPASKQRASSMLPLSQGRPMLRAPVGPALAGAVLGILMAAMLASNVACHTGSDHGGGVVSSGVEGFCATRESRCSVCENRDGGNPCKVGDMCMCLPW